MKLQDRDYTKYANEEEKDAYAAEEKYANQKGIIDNIPDFRIQMQRLENLFGTKGRCFQTIICILQNIEMLILGLKQMRIAK